jgi:hypothetical protein
MGIVIGKHVVLNGNTLAVFDVERSIFDEIPGLEFEHRREDGSKYYVRHGSISGEMQVTFYCEEPPLGGPDPTGSLGSEATV